MLKYNKKRESQVGEEPNRKKMRGKLQVKADPLCREKLPRGPPHRPRGNWFAVLRRDRNPGGQGSIGDISRALSALAVIASWRKNGSLGEP